MADFNVSDIARRLKDAHGNKAIAEAAQKAVALEAEGKKEEAMDWRRVDAALIQMQGPRQS